MYARCGWLVVVLIAGVLRLWQLDDVPLSPVEAHRALQALNVIRGSGWPMIPSSSFLLMSNVLGFSLFGPGNGIARLSAALGGWTIVGLPYFYRKHLGEVGALTASALLAFAPPLLLASRQVDGMTWGVLGAGLLIAAGNRELPLRWRLTMTVVGIAVGLTGGPAFFDLLLPWLLSEIVTRHALFVNISRRAMLGGLAAATLIAAGLGVHPEGWGDVGAGAAAWWHAWMGGCTQWLPFAYLLYEPLTFSLALVGLGFAWQRQNQIPLRWSWWAGLTLILTGLRPSDSALLLGAASVPMALLAGYGMNVILIEIVPSFRGWVAVQTMLGWILWLTGGLLLIQYAMRVTNALWPFLVLFALQIFLGGVFGLTIPPRWAGRGFLLGIAGALLLLQMSYAWGAAFDHPSSPAELLVAQAGSPDLTNLHHTLEVLMFRDGFRKDNQPLTFVADEAIQDLVVWTLRDFPRLQVVSTWPEDTTGPVLTSELLKPPDSRAQAGWQGMRFVVATQLYYSFPVCPQGHFICSEQIRWLLFRQGSPAPTLYSLLLWEPPHLLVQGQP